MVNIIGNESVEGVIINLAQKQRYTRGYHIGTLSRKPEWVEGDDGEFRRKFYWNPKDARSSEEANRELMTTVEKNCFVTFPANTISPRQVTWIVPQQYHDIPQAVQSESELQAGLFFNKFFYKPMKAMRGLEVVSQYQPEVEKAVKKVLDGQSGVLSEQHKENVQSTMEFLDDQSSSSSSRDDNES